MRGNRTQFAEAAARCEHALAIREAVFGRDSEPVAQVLHELGVLYRRRGMLEQSRASFTRALAIREARFPADHEAVRATRTWLESPGM